MGLWSAYLEKFGYDSLPQWKRWIYLSKTRFVTVVIKLQMEPNILKWDQTYKAKNNSPRSISTII